MVQWLKGAESGAWEAFSCFRPTFNDCVCGLWGWGLLGGALAECSLLSQVF